MKLSIISIIAITSSLNFNINLAHAQNFAHFDHMATKGSSNELPVRANAVLWPARNNNNDAGFCRLLRLVNDAYQRGLLAVENHGFFRHPDSPLS